MKAIVKFSVGVAHPLYNQPVQAELTWVCGGYNGRCINAETVAEIFFSANPHGILCYNGSKFTGYKTSPARIEKWSGWVDEIFNEELGYWETAEQYCDRQNAMIFLKENKNVG